MPVKMAQKEVKDLKKLLEQILWDYNITPEEIQAVLKGEAERAGHYTREAIFKKLVETYPWFTIIQIFSPEELKDLLTRDLIKDLRAPSLSEKYEFVRKRLQEILQASG